MKYRLCSLVLMAMADAALAQVTSMGLEQLQFAVKVSPPCCVIDGRRSEIRGKHPLVDALPYREGMKLNPTASVVVIADKDRDARKIAGALALSYPDKKIIAVKGGIRTWEATLHALAKGPTGGPTSYNFVIPRNTCESGSPIQSLRSKAP